MRRLTRLIALAVIPAVITLFGPATSAPAATYFWRIDSPVAKCVGTAPNIVYGIDNSPVSQALPPAPAVVSVTYTIDGGGPTAVPDPTASTFDNGVGATAYPFTHTFVFTLTVDGQTASMQTISVNCTANDTGSITANTFQQFTLPDPVVTAPSAAAIPATPAFTG